MTEDVIEKYDTFNTKGCPDELIFDEFNDQSIPSNYCNFLNDDYDSVNHFTRNPVYDALL